MRAFTARACILLALLLAADTALAQWIQLGPQALVTSLLRTKTTAFAGFLGNGVFVSSDDGASWVNMSAGLTNLDVNALAAMDSMVFAATGGDGVFVTTDNGAHWNPAADYLISWNVVGLTVIDSTLYAGPANYGAFLSTNSGKLWVPAGRGLATVTVNAYICKDSILLAGTVSRGVYRSLDTARTWEPANTGLPLWSNVVAFTIVGNAIFAGVAYSGIYRSTDQGLSWVPCNTGLTNKGVSCLAQLSLPARPLTLFAGTASGGLFTSHDTAQTWEPVELGLPSGLIGALTVRDSLVFVGVGQAVTVSTDGGFHWNPIGTGLATSGVNALAMAGNGVLYAGTATSGIFRSRSRGDFWERANEGLTNREVTALAPRGEEVYAGTTGGSVFHRKPGDSLWRGGGNGISQLYIHALIAGDSAVFAAAGKRGVFVSTDDGINWKPCAGTEDPVSGTEILCFGGGTASWLAGSNGQGVFRSTDRGKSWFTTNHGLTDLHVKDFATFIDRRVVDSLLIAATGAGIYGSLDDGYTWAERNNGLAGITVTTLALSPWYGVLLAGTEGHGVYASLDGGLTWHAANQGMEKVTVRSLIVDGINAYAGVALGGVCRRPLEEFASILGVQDEVTLPPDFRLAQNYPNPFNPTTYLRYSLPRRARVFLAVYNVLGQEVARLVEGVVGAGFHEVTFSGAACSSGLYLARLQAEGKLAVIKMMLVK